MAMATLTARSLGQASLRHQHELVDAYSNLLKDGSMNALAQMLELIAGVFRGLAAAALRDRIIDEIVVYVAPCLIGDGVSALGDLGVDDLTQAIRLDQVRTRRLGTDLLYTAEVRYTCSRES